ncbi:MAG: c-type cytochrome [Cyclobacteriaceae bacterium]
MINMGRDFNYFYSLVVVILLFSCNGKSPGKIDRPLDPWAFRSVLDKQPRMLTLALDSNMYVAYDLQKGQIYRLWKGGVILEGTVFTNKKNIQPSTWGADYQMKEQLLDAWEFYKGKESIDFDYQFKGYSLNNNQVILKYQFKLPDGRLVDVEEKPEYITNQDDMPGFERVFETQNVPEGIQIALKSDKETYFLPSNDREVRQSFFHPLPPQQRPDLNEQYDHLGILRMENSDCYTCHEETHKTVGPSFKEISKRYPKNKETYQKLTQRIIDGGKGNWGDTPMNAHPALSDSDIKTMLDYIFTYQPKEINNQARTLAVNTSNKSEIMVEKPQPGFGAALEGVHPSYDLTTIHHQDFQPRVGGLAFMPDGRLLVSTWDKIGGVYLVDGILEGDDSPVSVKRIAEGLSEPLGLEVVDGEIYVLQKHELTKLIDTNGDEIIDEYQTICDGWGVTDDFHEFAFGLVHKEDHFYITLSMAMRLMSNERQLPDRGRTLKISKDGSFERLDYGLRTPNGIGEGVDGELFVADNQGQWLPGNKLIHVQKGAYNGMAWGLSEEQENNPPKMVPPALWLPDAEIGNSPTEPIMMKDGPYKGQMLHGDVTHGGIKRDFIEKVNGVYQGAVFRFSQGFKAGVNRLAWGPDGALYIGEIGMVGGWSWKGNQYGLEKIKYNGKSTFEMLAIMAKPGGFEIVFTEPLEEGELDKDLLEIQQWWYQPTASYGGPKLDLEKLAPTQITLSEDRKKLNLKIPGLKEEHVVYFLLKDDLKSINGQPLWSSEAWYTLNQIPI